MTDTSPLPRGTTDCHVHVVGPTSRYAFQSPRAYTPEDAPLEALASMLDDCGVERVVLVQISIYRLDNSCLLDALSELGPRGRGIIHTSPETSAADLDLFDQSGVRGIRVNLSSTGISDPAEVRGRLRTAAKHCERNGWHVQIYATPSIIAEMAEDLLALPVPFVIDHFGLVSPCDREFQERRTLMSLIDSGRGWIKLSAPYRLGCKHDAPEIGELARDLYSTNPDRILWGSDWPHPPVHPGVPEADPPVTPYRKVEPKKCLQDMLDWFPGDKDRTKILAENPARLYEF
jgi:predicted TIM-barrel fold metal-dependent hydrolase